MRARLLSGLSIAALTLASPAFAQDVDGSPQATDTGEIVVTATRSRIPQDLRSTPLSVTIIDAEEISDQSKFGNDLGEILQRTVPGFGLSSSGSYSNFSQTLRGRKPAVFIDGVPTTTPLRDGGRDLRLISPSVIGRIEVVRGSTALYGLGGAGGLINYATKEPAEEGFQAQTDLALGLSLTHLGDSANLSADQTFTGRSGAIGFIVSGYYEKFNSLFDADGNRIPPNPQNQGGIADTEAYNIFGKLVFNLSDSQRLSLSGNFYRIEQDSEFSNRPGVAIFGVAPATAQRVRAPGGNEFTENWLTIGRYDNDDILGSQLSLQGYYGKYQARFPFFPPPLFPPAGGQSLIDAKRYGVRLDLNTPLTFVSPKANVLWGIDYQSDETFQPLERPGSPTVVFVPKLKQDSIAPFAQFSLPLTDWLTVNGGVRWEKAEVDADTFTTVRQNTTNLPGGVAVLGGTLKYSEVLFNGGVVVNPFYDGALSGLSLFAGYSQGFSVGDLGRALRATTATSIEQFGFRAQIIDSYEAGIRADFRGVRGSLSVFKSTSEFGSTFNALTLELLRAPEKVTGVEAAIDVDASDTWNVGGNVSYVDGDQENIVTGAITPLDTSRISPLKAVFYVGHEISENWAARAQFTYSGRQNRFPGNPQVFGRADIEAFGLLDLSLSGKVGPGKLTLAVNNVLNEFYFTPDAYRFATTNQFTAGRGATARISYSFTY